VMGSVAYFDFYFDVEAMNDERWGLYSWTSYS